MQQQTIILNQERNVTLTAYLQEVGGEFRFCKRPAILVLPGGGYAMCSDREADPVALAYMKAGFQAFVLRYSVGDYRQWPNPLADYEQAMDLLHQNADTWNLDSSRICAVGFSAGGHLCACAATIATHKPAAAILVYPAILKEICDMCQPGMPYPHEHVTAATSPCFLVAARDDRTVNIKNSLVMQMALAEKGIPFESHIYSYGGHGFSTGEDWIITNSLSCRTPNWINDSILWLKEVLGTLTPNGFTEPNIAICTNADNAPVLSVACTLNHIRQQSDEVQILLAPMYKCIQGIADDRGFSMEGLMTAVGGTTIRELMEMVMMEKETILRLDAALHNIVNQIK